MCPVHAREPVRTKTVADVLHNAPMQELVAQAELGRFVVMEDRGSYRHYAREDIAWGPFNLSHVTILSSRKAADKIAAGRSAKAQVMTLEEAMDRESSADPRTAVATPCRFIVGDNVRYKPGNEHDVGTVTDVQWDQKKGWYVVTADLPRGIFRAPVGYWDFALPSESNPDIAKATPGYNEAPTHHMLPTFPQKEQPKRIVRVMCWNAQQGHGFVYIRTEKGEDGVYSVYRSTARTFAFSKHVTTAEGVQIRRPYYVNLRNSISEIQNEGWKTGRPLRGGCTCPGYAGCGHCKHSDALVSLVTKGKI